MLRKFLVTCTALIMLVACGSTAPSSPNDVKKGEGERVLLYRGRDLHCLVTEQGGGGRESCDFVRFYQENPDLVLTSE